MSRMAAVVVRVEAVVEEAPEEVEAEVQAVVVAGRGWRPGRSLVRPSGC